MAEPAWELWCPPPLKEWTPCRLPWHVFLLTYLLLVAAITVFPSIGSLLFGYDVGATSYGVKQLQSSENAGVTWWYSLANSPLLQALLPAAAVAGALIGSVIGK